MDEATEVPAISLPDPRFKIGDTIYYPAAFPDYIPAPCPDCNDTAKWQVKTGSGIEFEVPCYRCHRHGGPIYMKKVVVTKVHSLTISRITAECGIPGRHERAHKVTYRDRQHVCLEEHRACATEGEAHAIAVEMGAKAQAEYETTPEHSRATLLSEMALRDALIFEANRLRIEAEVKYEQALDKIREMKDAYTGLRIEKYSSADSAQEFLAAGCWRSSAKACRTSGARINGRQPPGI